LCPELLIGAMRDLMFGKKNILKAFIILFLSLVFLAITLYVLGSFVAPDLNEKELLDDEVAMTSLPTSSISDVLERRLSVALPEDDYEIAKIDRETNLDRADLMVAVLNGSGERGAAKTLSEYLEDLGYKIVKVDNADGFGYADLSIMVKEDKNSFLDLLKKDIESNPAFASVSSARVYDNINSDAVVIIGE